MEGLWLEVPLLTVQSKLCWSRFLKACQDCLQRWRLLSGQPASVFDHPHHKKSYFWGLNGISCILVCARCLLAIPWVPLRGTWLHQLCLSPWTGSPWAFSSLGQQSRLSQPLLVWQMLQSLHHLHVPVSALGRPAPVRTGDWGCSSPGAGLGTSS